MPLYRLGPLSPTVPAMGEFWVAPDAQVIGAVTLREGVGVWFGAVLRGDNEPIAIGASTNVQEHVMAHTDAGFPLSVGRGCTIGHRAILHGCTIEDDVLIGMGAIVMNGARIGAGSVVGAGALVTEGKVFPARSLVVGSPARVVRELDAASVQATRTSASHYVAAWRRFSATLSPFSAGEPA